MPNRRLSEEYPRMADWNTKLHGFLTLYDREILAGLGKLSKELADTLALQEYRQFGHAQALPADFEIDFDRAIKKIGPPGEPDETR